MESREATHEPDYQDHHQDGTQTHARPVASVPFIAEVKAAEAEKQDENYQYEQHGSPRKQRSRVDGNFCTSQARQAETRQPTARGTRVRLIDERRQYEQYQGENEQNQGKHFVSTSLPW